MSVSPVVTSGFVSAPVLVSNAGWDQLANAKYADASRTFVNKIVNNVDAGESRVGYALAMASSGDLNSGVWAMKRAFASNAAEVGGLMFDEKLKPMVEDVTRKYEAQMDAGQTDDNAFMLAALYQMQGDPEMASMAADYIKNIKSEPATANLAKLVATEMYAIPMTHGAGWDLLAEGRSAEAISAFIDEMGKDGKAGAPKLGYGLAYAEIGDFKQAAWAIKRAFEVDPEGVSNIMLDGKLRPTLEKITAKFEQSDTMPLNENNSLVLGTLYQLQGDLEGAEFVVDPEAEDQKFLVNMVNEEMKMQKEMMAEAMPEMEMMDKEHPVFTPEPPAELLAGVTEKEMMQPEAKMMEMAKTMEMEESNPVLEAPMAPKPMTPVENIPVVTGEIIVDSSPNLMTDTQPMGPEEKPMEPNPDGNPAAATIPKTDSVDMEMVDIEK